MLTVKYTKLALQDLNKAYEYICSENPLSASEIIEKIEITISHLQTQPYIGYAGRVKNTYEFFVFGTPFIIVYMVNEDYLIIVSVLHTSKKYP